MAINGWSFKLQNERGIRCYARFIYCILGHECSVLYRWYEQYFIIYEGDREEKYEDERNVSQIDETI